MSPSYVTNCVICIFSVLAQSSRPGAPATSSRSRRGSASANRSAGTGTWIARYYVGQSAYETTALGLADDQTAADKVKVFDYWQAQEKARAWGERQRLIQNGVIQAGPYSVGDVTRDYLEALDAEKGPRAKRNAK